MSDGTVKLPAIGTVPTKYVYAGGALVVGVAGFAWWRRGAAAAAAVPTTPATDPAFGLDEGVNDGTGSSFTGPNGSTVTGTVTGTAPTTPQEWSNAAVQALAGSLWDTQQATSAVGKYIAQDPAGLSVNEVLMIQSALALVGTVPGGRSYRIIPAHVTTTPPPATKPPAAAPAATATIQPGQSVYLLMQMAHPKGNPAWWANQALRSIHYNSDHGIFPWPRGVPGPVLIYYRMPKSARIYIL